MSPDMVAALERQQETTSTELSDWHYWRLVGEGILVDLVAVEGWGLTSTAWMGVHAAKPFRMADGDASYHMPDCRALKGAPGWCCVDAARGDRLIKAWAADRDDAPIWAALEQLAGEIQW